MGKLRNQWRDDLDAFGSVPALDREGLDVSGTPGGDRLTGTRSDDYFNMSQGGRDSVRALAGNDIVNFGNTLDSTDMFDGGAGDDYLQLQGTYAGLTITGSMLKNVESINLLSGGDYTLTINAPVTSISLGGAHNVITLGATVVASPSGLNISGSSFNLSNVVDGSATLGPLSMLANKGNDTFIGGAGNDYFSARPSSGTDSFDGGGGFNRITLSSFYATGVTLDLADADVQVVADTSLTIRNIQHAFGSVANDVLYGTAEGNWLLGGAGDDRLYGRAGDDLLDVGVNTNFYTGDDTPIFATNGLVDGGVGGADVVGFFSNGGNTAGATISLAIRSAQDTGQGIYRIINVEGISGTSFDDVLTGDGKANRLFGFYGADHLIGGAGDDLLYGDARFTILSQGAGSGPLGIEFPDGAVFSDTLEGGTGSDHLEGNDGDDTLIGGVGADLLIGGKGDDRFVFTSVKDSVGGKVDTIQDFTAGDRIDVSAIDADPALRGNQAFHFGAAAGHIGDIVAAFDAATGTTTVNLYVNADGQADMTIHLTGNVALTAADFIL